jgi:hypothetical protein
MDTTEYRIIKSLARKKTLHRTQDVAQEAALYVLEARGRGVAHVNFKIAVKKAHSKVIRGSIGGTYIRASEDGVQWQTKEVFTDSIDEYATDTSKERYDPRLRIELLLLARRVLTLQERRFFRTWIAEGSSRIEAKAALGITEIEMYKESDRIVRRLQRGYEYPHLTVRNVAYKNRLDAMMVTINGETKSASEWITTSGVNKRTFLARLRRGVQGEALLQTSTVGASPPITFQGVTRNREEWAKYFGISIGILKRGLKVYEPDRLLGLLQRMKDVNFDQKTLTHWRRQGVCMEECARRFEERNMVEQ